MRRCLVPVISLLTVLSLASAAATEENQIIAFGDFFPEIQLPSPVDPGARTYLGLPAGASFTPSRIKAEVLLVELINVHCPHCQMQTPSYNELFNLIEANPGTRGRIKMLGIAVGNLEDEVKIFRDRFQVKFPVFADPRFEAWRAIGGSATPFSIFVRQDEPGSPGVVADTHLGLNTHYQKIYVELQQIAAEDPIVLRRQGKETQRIHQTIEPLFPERDLKDRVRQAFIDTGGRIDNFARLQLRSGRKVYMAIMKRGESRERLFAEAVSRTSICDICHDIHFIYVFETSGRVVGFMPLQLTKYGNVNWNAREIEIMRRRVIGKNLAAPLKFDPKVDAITSATMTSAMIFDSLDQGEKLLQELRQKGLLTE